MARFNIVTAQIAARADTTAARIVRELAVRQLALL